MQLVVLKAVLADKLAARGTDHPQPEADLGPVCIRPRKSQCRQAVVPGIAQLQPVISTCGSGHQTRFHRALTDGTQQVAVQPGNEYLVLRPHGANQRRPAAVACVQLAVCHCQIEPAVVNGTEQHRIALATGQIDTQTLAIAVQ